MDINYELYKVFYHVAITLSFSEASKQLFISPLMELFQIWHQKIAADGVACPNVKLSHAKIIVEQAVFPAAD